MQDSAQSNPWAPNPVADASTGLQPQDLPSPDLPPPPAETAIVFDGAWKTWVALNAKGLALTIPTFGFYRFWLKTDRRRFMWHSISINGDRLEYRGTPRELLTGFLFAIAIYLPLTVAYSLLGLYAETFQAFASVPFFLFTAIFGYYAVYRARRYRLTRTVFRGVRFWMDGSAWRYAFLALGWYVATGLILGIAWYVGTLFQDDIVDLAIETGFGWRHILLTFGWFAFVALTLGIAWTWMTAQLERYKMEHSWFGDLQGSFSGTGGRLFRSLSLLCIGLVISVSIPIMNVVLVPFIVVAIFTSIIRWTLNGIAFGSVRVSARISAIDLIGPFFLTALAMAALVALWLPLGVYGVFYVDGTDLTASSFWDSVWGAMSLALKTPFNMAFALVWMLIGLIGLSFIKQVLFDFPRMKLIAQTTTLIGAEALANVKARGDADSAFGEGLADALGADGF